MRSIDELRTLINQDFLIRFDTGRNSRLVSLPTLADLISEARARHLAEKALKSRDNHPTFRAKGHVIVFYWR